MYVLGVQCTLGVAQYTLICHYLTVQRTLDMKFPVQNPVKYQPTASSLLSLDPAALHALHKVSMQEGPFVTSLRLLLAGASEHRVFLSFYPMCPGYVCHA